jgi:archaemetzincin
MEKKKNKFKKPNKTSRLKAIGDISILPNNSLKKILKTAEEFHKPIYTPEEEDWLSCEEEDGQTFDQFLYDRYNLMSVNRNIIYINPLQEMPQQFLDNILLYSQSFFYPMEVKLINIVSLQSLKVKSRINQYSKKIQYHAGQINSKTVKYVPNDAHCMISILLDDLYPESSWNYVFGLASIDERVGVFSFARYSSSFEKKNEAINFDNYLLYCSCSTLTHEICHTFGLEHCIYYTCLMNGCNNMEEAKKQPLYECPVCLRKLQYSIGFDILERYKKMLNVTKMFGGYFDIARKWYEKRINSI